MKRLLLMVTAVVVAALAAVAFVIPAMAQAAPPNPPPPPGVKGSTEWRTWVVQGDCDTSSLKAYIGDKSLMLWRPAPGVTVTKMYITHQVQKKNVLGKWVNMDMPVASPLWSDPQPGKAYEDDYNFFPSFFPGADYYGDWRVEVTFRWFERAGNKWYDQIERIPCHI